MPLYSCLFTSHNKTFQGFLEKKQNTSRTQPECSYNNAFMHTGYVTNKAVAHILFSAHKGKCEYIEEIHAHIAYYLLQTPSTFLCSLNKNTIWTSCGISPCPIPMCQLPERFSELHLTRRYMPNCMENEETEPSFASRFPLRCQVPRNASSALNLHHDVSEKKI